MKSVDRSALQRQKFFLLFLSLFFGRFSTFSDGSLQVVAYRKFEPLCLNSLTRQYYAVKLWSKRPTALCRGNFVQIPCIRLFDLKQSKVWSRGVSVTETGRCHGIISSSAGDQLHAPAVVRRRKTVLRAHRRHPLCRT
jgi:hypothetical protein